MRKQLTIISAVAASLAALCGCQKMTGPVAGQAVEMAFTPVSESPASKGFTEGGAFEETSVGQLHSGVKTTSWRVMQVSSYLHPQNDADGNYFIDKTFSHSNTEGVWWNTNVVGGEHESIYWPVSGILDFLAYSTSVEDSEGIVAIWDENDASSKVTLSVPAENSQNDIMYASAFGIKASNKTDAVPLKFKHAQAWLQFKVTCEEGSHAQLRSIVLENVYNAGDLTIRNGRGNTTAVWDFSTESRHDIEVDNRYMVTDLGTSSQYMDMLIPQQSKTNIVVHYSYGTGEVLSHSIKTDLKTWLMGEKYVYSINIRAREVTVDPEIETPVE